MIKSLMKRPRVELDWSGGYCSDEKPCTDMPLAVAFACVYHICVRLEMDDSKILELKENYTNRLS